MQRITKLYRQAHELARAGELDAAARLVSQAASEVTAAVPGQASASDLVELQTLVSELQSEVLDQQRRVGERLRSSRQLHSGSAAYKATAKLA